MFEASIGAAYHQDIYYYEQKSENRSESDWFRRNTKWSPAFRLGTKLFIPVDSYGDCCLTLGGGYTFLTNNNNYSSWDVNLGITF